MAETRVFTLDEKHIDLPDAYGVPSKNRLGGTHGEDVFIGVIDSGVNILHSAFLTTDAVPRTRIASIWIQHGQATTGTTDLWTRWGTLFSEAEINQVLDRVAQGKTVAVAVRELRPSLTTVESGHLADRLLDLKNRSSHHGTSVASVAAGTPWRRNNGANLIGGVAPAAKLIVVARAGATDGLGFNYEAELAASVRYCFTQSGSRPCVVNISMGSIRAPHNGRSQFNKLVGPQLEQPGRVVVAAVGNSGHRHKHARFAAPRTVNFVLPDATFPQIYMFLSSKEDILVRLHPPATSAVPAGQRHAIVESTSSQDDDTGFKHTVILVIASAPHRFVAGPDWRIEIEGVSPIVDLWIRAVGSEDNADDIRIIPVDPASGSREDSGLMPEWVRPKSSIQHTLTPIACGKDVIAVSSMFMFQGETDFQFLSSRGPPTDAGRDQQKDSKPDIAAPGFAIRTALWRPSASLGSKGFSTAKDKEGTSFAAPFVTGTVALMLSHNPNLTAAGIRDILRKNTRLPFGVQADEVNFLRTHQDIEIGDFLGKGVLSVKRTLQKVSADLGP